MKHNNTGIIFCEFRAFSPVYFNFRHLHLEDTTLALCPVVAFNEEKT